MEINTMDESLQALRALPQPEPMPNKAAYDNERELCLTADPRRRENYERYLASTRRSAQVNYLPIKLDVEPVSRRAANGSLAACS
jgi:hypothetical protein